MSRPRTKRQSIPIAIPIIQIHVITIINCSLSPLRPGLEVNILKPAMSALILVAARIISCDKKRPERRSTGYQDPDLGDNKMPEKRPGSVNGAVVHQARGADDRETDDEDCEAE